MTSSRHEMKDVAVVIPCYNSGEFLQEAVDSALKQDCPVEVIIVDDGSTDASTLSLLDKLRAGGIRVHRQPNKGPGEARNAGIQSTSAEYIVCLDADDRLQPDYCSRCLEALRAHPRAGFVYSTTQVFGAQQYLWSKLDYSALHFLIDNYIPISAMFRRQVWERTGGFSQDMSRGYEDWDFWLSAIQKGWDGHHIPEPLFWYRKHGATGLAADNLKRRELKRLLKQRHRDLYSGRMIAGLLVKERFPLLRILGAAVKETPLRPVLRRLRSMRP